MKNLVFTSIKPFEDNEIYAPVHLVTEDDFIGHQGHDMFDPMNDEIR